MNNNEAKIDKLEVDLKKLSKVIADAYKEEQEFMEKYYPTDIPNKVCNHAFIQGVKFENSFMPRLHDFTPFMRCGDEELFLWTFKKDTETSLVSKVSTDVKSKNFWKNFGNVIELAFSYSRDFEHTMDVEYKWCYYFDPNKSIFEQEIYNFSELDSYSILNGTILKLTDIYYLSPLLELLLRDDKAYTAMSVFYASMKTHYCCLICELERFPFKKHQSHEPEVWEQAKVIPKLETAIVQACRCIEALIGKPPKRDNRSRLLEHKQKWIEQLGINPDDTFIKTGTTFIDFYYELFDLRNDAAHSYGKIPFNLERKQAINAQCFALLLLEGYINKNVLSLENSVKELSINEKVIDRVDQTMSTSKTY